MCRKWWRSASAPVTSSMRWLVSCLCMVPVCVDQAGHGHPSEVECLGVALEAGSERHVGGCRPVTRRQVVGTAGQSFGGEQSQCRFDRRRAQRTAADQVLDGCLSLCGQKPVYGSLGCREPTAPSVTGFPLA